EDIQLYQAVEHFGYATNCIIIHNRMIYNGNHLALDKMISRFKNNLILDLDKVEVQKEVDQFFRD
ncbi:MAG: hypothetical protein AAFN93_13720, partial [Bacteroidota bacterium]